MNTKQLAALLLPACMALGSHTVSAGVHGGSANIDDVISGTASDPSDGVGPNVVLDVEGDDGEAVIGEAKLVASLTIGQDHEINFVEIEEEAGPPNVLVSETHRPRSLSALEQLIELAREGVTAHDVFYAMSERGTEVPERIALLEQGLTGVAQGWGLRRLKKLGNQEVSNAGANANACTNSTFTASTYGGILPNNASWLDRHPSEEYSQYLYSYQDGILRHVNSPRVAFTLSRYNIRQYRGKVCLETIEGAGLPVHGYYDNNNVWHNLNPHVSFLYRRPNNNGWYSAASMTVPVGQTQAMEWAWFGWNNELWDWRVSASRAHPQDYIDYMRSYLE